jgi:hypothetical protein
VEFAIPPAVGLTLVGFKDAVRLLDVVSAVKVTVLAKPLTLVIVIVEIPEPPVRNVTLVGFPLMKKLGRTESVIVVE